MRERTIRVYEVCADLDNQFGGPAGDGMQCFRFRNHDEAQRFANGRTCWGHPAHVQVDDVPRRLAQRWGVA